MDISKRNYSNLEDKFSIKIPEKQNSNLTTATMLLEKRREMIEIENAFNSQKDEFKMKMESFRQRKHELDRKELELSSSLLKFNKFLKENESKRNRALHKTSIELENQKNKDKEIMDFKQTLVLYRNKQEKLKSKLERYRLYLTFFESVIEITEEFTEIKEIVDRYSTLASAHDDLLERNKNNQIAVNEEKQNMMQLKENSNGQIIRCNNRQGILQLEYDRLQSISLEKSAEWNSLISEVAQKTLEYGKIKMATSNLYFISQKFLGNKINSLNIVDTLKQLDKINIFIEDLQYILKEVNNDDELSEI